MERFEKNKPLFLDASQDENILALLLGKNLAVIYQKWSERTPGIISDLPGDESRPNKQ